jgi:hypothetical protein
VVPEIKELFSISNDLVSESKLFSVVEPKGLGSITPLATIKSYNSPPNSLTSLFRVLPSLTHP